MDDKFSYHEGGIKRKKTVLHDTAARDLLYFKKVFLRHWKHTLPEKLIGTTIRKKK